MRALILLLALLLPLQLSWAGMATYCQAGNDRTSSHPGHHEHGDESIKLQADKQEQPLSEQDKSPAIDSDLGCSLCHFSCMKPVQLERSGIATPLASALKIAPIPSRHPASRIADRPDKPNWTLAA